MKEAAALSWASRTELNPAREDCLAAASFLTVPRCCLISIYIIKCPITSLHTKVCLISPGTDLPGEWALLALGSFLGLLRQTLHTRDHTYMMSAQRGGGGYPQKQT